jgi:hypothetical protein
MMKPCFWCFAILLPFFCDRPSTRAEQPTKPAQSDVYQVPYKLTEVKHVLLRAKINGKGPFNFILDTGAPALFVSTGVCKKLGIEPDAKGWGTFDDFEIEGGVKIKKARGRIENPFQLDGMNAMGLSGVELHGVIGYNILARYKLEFDFTLDKMTWTALDFEPKEPQGLDGKPAANMDAMAAMTKIMTAFIGKPQKPELKPRGYLGLELSQEKETVSVSAALKDGPAALAGLASGDVISTFQGKDVHSINQLVDLAREILPTQEVKLKISRTNETMEITFKAGEGL